MVFLRNKEFLKEKSNLFFFFQISIICLFFLVCILIFLLFCFV